jgi:transposase
MQATSDLDYKSLYEQAKAQLEQALGTIALLQHRIEQLEKIAFGSKQERFVPSASPVVADPSVPVAVSTPEQTTQITYTRTQKTRVQKVIHPGRGKLPDHLRREDIVLEPIFLPQGSIRIGELISEQLEYIPAELYVKRYIRPKYVLPTAPGDTDAKIIVVPLPIQPVDKCMAGPGLLAQLLIDKYLDHLPAYRQGQRFERNGVSLPYSTLLSWIALAAGLLEVLYEALQKELLQTGYIQADETGIKVLDQNKSGKKIHNGFFWVYQNSIQKLVFFDYQPTRKKEVPQGMLATFKGYLQSDGYDAYDDFDHREGIVHLHCMAHARRYFVDAVSSDKPRAEYALQQFQELYAIERRCREKELSFEQRKEVRQKEAVPILVNLGQWMKAQQPEVLPQSPMGKALNYCLKRWEKLCRYTEDGMLSIDNNPVENSIRPLALGRKNYLFCGSEDAAQRTAMVYSLLGCCKLQGIDPYLWLKDVLTRLPLHPINQIKELLPHNWKPAQVAASNNN